MNTSFFASPRLRASAFSWMRFVCLAVIACVFASPAAAFDLASPDGRNVITVTPGEPLTWSVTAGGRTVLLPSRLGMELADGPFPLGPVSIAREQVREVDQTWQWDFGAQRNIRNHYREATLTLRETRPGGRTFNLVLRAYDDGVALRYVFPGDFQGLGRFRLKEERTEFTFDRDYRSWIGDHKTNYGHQECEYPAGSLARLTPASFGTAPIVVDMGDGLYVALAEAALANWSGMYFAGAATNPLPPGEGRVRGQQKSDSTESSPSPQPSPGGRGSVTLVSKLSARPEGDPLAAVATVATPLPARSPWRVVMIGGSPGDLIESNLLLNLNDPSRIRDTSWIKPGMCAWDHWWHGEQKMETAVIKEYIDLAAAMGWPYQLIDWHWYGDPEAPDANVFHVNPAIDLPEIRRYAAEKGVKLWVWLRWNHIEKPEIYEKLFPLLHEWGIVGVKIDFMQRDDQAMVQWYQDVVKAAAANRLMVDFHGAYKPTGEQRTWPNLITREGVKGNEFNKWSHEVTPTHRCTLPFTRMLMGPMDFTPGGFNNRQPGQHQTSSTNAEVQGTRAQELALFVAYLSPFMCVCDHPKNILGQPGAEFLKLVPTVWDETRVLSGEIGDSLVIARRSGKRWFLAGLTNEKEREMQVDLDFLPPGRWHAKLWEDGPNAATDATDLATREVDLTADDQLTVRLASAGGFAAVFEASE